MTRPGAPLPPPRVVPIEERVTRVLGWLRDHELVLGGPSVRAGLAMVELAAGWDEMGGEPAGGLERVALMAVPHRMRTKPGVDADALVRAAVRYARSGQEPQSHPAESVPDKSRPRRTAQGDEEAVLIPPRPREKRYPSSVFSERALQRLVHDILVPERLWASSTGPTATLPARRLPGEDALYPAPLGAGDRSRDVSVRHTLRAAIRHGGDIGVRDLPALRREPTTRYDIVLAVDVSASMADSELSFVVAASRGLAEGLVRSGQRVGIVAFAEDAVVAQELTRDPRRLDPEEYHFARSTNIEAALIAARRLLARGAVNGHQRRIVVLSDSEPTAYSNRPPTPKDEQRAAGWAERYPGRDGFRLRDARRAALGAARRCLADGARVSVVLPGAVGDAKFARLLANAGGGVVRALDPSLAIHRALAEAPVPVEWPGRLVGLRTRPWTEWEELTRCPWGGSPEIYRAYHDDEWGRPVTDDVRIYEKLCLEGFQSGLSWLTILRKRDAFRVAFAGFDPKEVADFGEEDITRLLGDAGIVRHRGKIEATIANARATLATQADVGSLAALVWRYEPEATAARRAPEAMADLPTTIPEAVALSKELRRRGFRFVGPTTAYSAMQSLGMVNDHLTGCFVHDAVEALRSGLVRPIA